MAREPCVNVTTVALFGVGSAFHLMLVEPQLAKREAREVLCVCGSCHAKSRVWVAKLSAHAHLPQAEHSDCSTTD